MSKMKLLLDVVEDLRTLASSLESLSTAVADPDASPPPQVPTEAPVSPPAAEQPSPTEPMLSIVELRAFVAERSTPENRPRIKAILGNFGVNKLTELKEEQYTDLMREVAAL